jgi:hypothetical protein
MTQYDISPLYHPGIKILPRSTAEGIELEFIGDISMEAPSKTFFPYVEKVHQEAIEHGASEVRLNLTKLAYPIRATRCLSSTARLSSGSA